MKRGDIILTEFHFSDYSGYKNRPSLIVSANQSQTDDYIIAFTSTIIPQPNIHPTHHIIRQTENYFQQTGLHKDSIIKCDKLMTVHNSVILGWMGNVPIHVMNIIDQKLKLALELN